MLPVKYFHVVFTVPDKLNKLFLNNQKEMYNLLFSVAWDVMKDFGNTKKWIGGKIGTTAILHTSGQKMNYHPHLHLIVPACALKKNNKWKHSRKRGKYLFKVDQLSNVFRARFVEQVRKLLNEKSINGIEPNGLFEKEWVVYAKQSFCGPKQVINYLSRYTHRTAISNNRILNVDDKNVTFSWKDYKNDNAKQIKTISGEKFITLFCNHILPHGFTRIRHYGFLSSASKAKSLAIIRSDLNVNHLHEGTTKKTWQEIVFERMGIMPGICKCGGRMEVVQTFKDKFKNKSKAPPKNICSNTNFYKSVI